MVPPDPKPMSTPPTLPVSFVSDEDALVLVLSSAQAAELGIAEGSRYSVAVGDGEVSLTALDDASVSE